MPKDQDFVDFVVDQVQGGCEMTYRHMFGGTTLYMRGKVVGLICDNQLFVKPPEAGRAYIGTVVEAPPYEGAKNSFLIEEGIEDREWLNELLVNTENQLSAPKLKKRRKKRKRKSKKNNRKKQVAAPNGRFAH